MGSRGCLPEYSTEPGDGGDVLAEVEERFKVSISGIYGKYKNGGLRMDRWIILSSFLGQAVWVKKWKRKIGCKKKILSSYLIFLTEMKMIILSFLIF